MSLRQGIQRLVCNWPSSHHPPKRKSTGYLTRLASLPICWIQRRAINTLHTEEARPRTLCDYGLRVLYSKDGTEKATLTQEASRQWQDNQLELEDERSRDVVPPDRPARPPLPELREKKFTPGPKEAGVTLPVYLLHSLAHIELNAVDLGWDLVLRFRNEKLPPQFYSDWLSILSDEARHFMLLCKRLQASASFYGAIPSHDSLLRDGQATGNNLKARIAVVQLVHEAHGLDSWERLVKRFYSADDHESARLVDTICREEVDHVNKGLKWFKYLCERDGVDAVQYFHEVVRQYALPIPGPFNTKARNEAGMPQEWYVPLETPPRHPRKPTKATAQAKASSPAQRTEEPR